MEALATVEMGQKSPRLVRVVKGAKAKVIKLRVSQKKQKKAGLSLQAQQRMILEYRPKARKLARSILRKWHSRLDIEEVDSVVDLSLCEAIRRFNPTKGASFMTFMFYHLRGNLIRTVASAANAKVVPLGDAALIDGMLQGNENGRAGGSNGINAIEIAEALCNHEYPLPDEILFRKEMVSLSHKAFERLDALERQVIQKVYLEEQQLIDIAQKLGYSRCHISRVKRKALETLFDELRATSGYDKVGIGALDDSGKVPVSRRRPFGRRLIQRRCPKALRAKQPEERQVVGYY